MIHLRGPAAFRVQCMGGQGTLETALPTLSRFGDNTWCPQVSWEFWTNSNDQCGPVCDVQKEFIKEFVPVAKVRRRGSASGWP